MNWGGAVLIVIALFLVAMAYHGTYPEVGRILGISSGRTALAK